jgi:acylglycerol lipase
VNTELVIHQEGAWTTPDGSSIYTQSWEPSQGTRGTLVLVHGIGEHSGRYRHVAEYFCQAGLSTLSFDLRGHGHSDGVRGHADSYEVLMDDIQHFLEEARHNSAGCPVYLYGHSMGGSLVLYYGLTRTTLPDGIIATSPGLAPAQAISPSKLWLGKMMAVLWPTLTMKNDLDLSGISRQKEVIDAYIADPLVHPLISARLGLELINRGAWMCAQERTFPTPLLLMQGTADRLVNKELPRKFAGLVKGDVEYQSWEGWYHELHNEVQYTQVLDTMVNWINRHPQNMSLKS